MHELTVSLKGLNQDQLEKLQDVYYSLAALGAALARVKNTSTC